MKKGEAKVVDTWQILYMDFEEAKAKRQITPEERASVERYINFYHEQMNALSAFDVREYLRAASRGWDLVGTRNDDRTEEEQISIIMQSVEDLANVYSAMCKYGNGRLPFTLMRGTSVREADRLYKGKTYDKILSTTTDKTTAMSFGDARGPALLRITTGDGIPYIDVTDFVRRRKLK